MCRHPAVHRGEVLAILPSEALLIALGRDGTKALLPHGLHLGRRRACLDATAASVEAHPGSVVYDDRTVNVGVANDGGIHPHHCGVVAEIAAVPPAAIEAVAAIAETVIHAAIEAYRRTPVAGIPEIGSVVPAPVTRCPEQAHGWCEHPCSWNPVVAVRPSPCPVTRGPDVICRRAYRLVINRQFRRSHGDGNANGNLRERRAGQRAQNCNQNQIAEPGKDFHLGCTLPIILRLPCYVLDCRASRSDWRYCATLIREPAKSHMLLRDTELQVRLTRNLWNRLELPDDAIFSQRPAGQYPLSMAFRLCRRVA